MISAVVSFNLMIEMSLIVILPNLGSVHFANLAMHLIRRARIDWRCNESTELFHVAMRSKGETQPEPCVKNILASTSRGPQQHWIDNQ